VGGNRGFTVSDLPGALDTADLLISLSFRLKNVGHAWLVCAMSQRRIEGVQKNKETLR
jgi:hypothetical protein